MGKTKQLRRRKISIPKLPKASKRKDNVVAGMRDDIGIEALNKSKFLKDAGLPRSTVYQLFKRKNPTIQTLAKIVHAAHQAVAY